MWFPLIYLLSLYFHHFKMSCNWNIIVGIFFFDQLLSCSNVHLRFVYILSWSGSLFIILSRIQLQNNVTVYLYNTVLPQFMHAFLCKQLVSQQNHLTKFCFYLQNLHQVTNMTIAIFTNTNMAIFFKIVDHIKFLNRGTTVCCLFLVRDSNIYGCSQHVHADLCVYTMLSFVNKLPNYSPNWPYHSELPPAMNESL